MFLQTCAGVPDSEWLEIWDGYYKYEGQTLNYYEIQIIGDEGSEVWFCNCTLNIHELWLSSNARMYMLGSVLNTTYITIMNGAHLYLCNNSNQIICAAPIDPAVAGRIINVWLAWSNFNIDVNGVRSTFFWLPNGTYDYSIAEPHYVPTSGNFTISGAGVELELELVPDWDEDSVPDDEDPDDDNDGYADVLEEALGSDPKDNASRPADNDGDLLPDVNDPDDDNDGWNDTEETGAGSDPFDNSSAPHDLDADGVPDYRDDDMDGDGWNNTVEQQCGTDTRDNKSRPKDYDEDGVPDLLDPDDDDDGYNDAFDKFPLNPTEWNDTDLDGVGDNSDIDIDDDGYVNEGDAFPYDPDEWLDTDGDGVGDNADPDDDDDNFTDLQEYDNGTNPLDALDFPFIIPDPPGPDGEDNETENETEDGADNDTAPDGEDNDTEPDGADNGTAPIDGAGDGIDGGDISDGGNELPDGNNPTDKEGGSLSMFLWVGFIVLSLLVCALVIFLLVSRRPQSAPANTLIYKTVTPDTIIEPDVALEVQFKMKSRKPKKPLDPIDL